MASPHVAGVAALILDHDDAASPAEAAAAIAADASTGLITNVGAGSPKKLLFTD